VTHSALSGALKTMGKETKNETKKVEDMTPADLKDSLESAAAAPLSVSPDAADMAPVALFQTAKDQLDKLLI
jgi:hypothetical protein